MQERILAKGTIYPADKCEVRETIVAITVIANPGPAANGGEAADISSRFHRTFDPSLPGEGIPHCETRHGIQAKIGSPSDQ